MATEEEFWQSWIKSVAQLDFDCVQYAVQAHNLTREEAIKQLVKNHHAAIFSLENLLGAEKLN